MLALRRNDANAAVEALETARAAEGGNPAFLAAYVRGQAFLMLHDGQKAAAEFQKFITYRGAVWMAPWGSLARLGLARAYAMQGDSARARASYQEFSNIWKNADPSIPLLQQAKAEAARLQ